LIVSTKTSKPTGKGKAQVKKAKPAKPARAAGAKKSAPAQKRPVASAKSKVKPATKPMVKKAPAKPAAKKVAVKKAAPKPAARKATKTAPAKSKPKAVVKKAAVPAGKTPQKAAPPAPAKSAKTKAAPAAVKASPPPKATASTSSALYYDGHMHTPLCKHAWGEPEEYAEQGIRAGLKGIIFTCHCPMPDGFWPTVRMADSEFDTYLEIVARASKAFEGRLDVRLGLESEFYPGMEPWIEKLHQRADFDFILGGLHWQAREYLGKFETGTIEAFRKCYFNHLAESAETGLYDCLAHPDLVKNYHPDSWCLAIVKDSIAKALDRIAATGVAMELNTSGLNKSYSEMNPGLEMLRMMADRQIPIVLGSDAHRPHRVGEHFMTALSHLQEAGYDEVSYFLKRQRVNLKISAVQASIKKSADAQTTA
jgi:HisJ family histidinol phosphate phosphatase